MKYVKPHLRSACAIGSVSFFILFLAASQPHRVHHLFENLYAPAKGTWAGHQHDPHHAQHANHRYHDRRDYVPYQDGHRHHHLHDHHHQQDDDGGAPQLNLHSEIPDGAPEPLHANTPKRDANHDASAQTYCIVQAAAQHTHVLQLSGGAFIFPQAQHQDFFDRDFSRSTHFNPSPFSQRAPPRVS